ncbi:hypothetical protein BBP00_00004582 [Phytophthora kernoviae]|uniref:Rhodanese domain-containing protein n=1 Tax=Phytophthora kernoviae TaxID=325452 RepID=A0A3F2RRE5_9STRA|nr:hypothetical protein BBP00_00004582 [Phytophthora kernoviae]
MDDQAYTVVLYYKYVRLCETQEELQAFADAHEKLCLSLQLTGRVRLAFEGINGTLGGSLSNVQSYVENMKQQPQFVDVDWKTSNSPVPPFPELQVRCVAEIVALELPDDVYDLTKRGTHLTPEQFREEQLSADPSSIAVIDVRNTYEFQIGHFAGALNPKTRRFGQFPQWVRDELPELQQKDKVLMYCTGGIRCEKASAYLKHLGLENVYQLEGGIHRYLEKFPDGGGLFQGKNFVFDQRVTMASEDKTITGQCEHCHVPHDTLSGTRCAYCRMHVLLCEPCRAATQEQGETDDGVFCTDHLPMVSGTLEELQTRLKGLQDSLENEHGRGKKGRRRSLRKQVMRGAGRRGGVGGHRVGGNGRRSVTNNGLSDPKTSLVDEWRAHEEDCAARVLQNQLRAFLSRQRMARLLLSVYEKHYDSVRKQYFYVNTLTNISTWEKPLLLARFLPGDRNVARGRAELSPKEAALRIQRVIRAFLAKKTIRQLVRENYMKLFDPESKGFYYLNTRTGERSEQKPPFFRPKASTGDSTSYKQFPSRNKLDDEDDLEIEPFHFRKAVCKISSEGNPHGSGVLGRFCGILCILTDGKTLSDENIARSARVVCNYADERVPFPVVLASETLFAGIKMQDEHTIRLQPLAQSPQPPKKMPQQPHFNFALCAVNERQFLLAAGDNVVPLRFEMSDRKLGCGESECLRLGEPLEVVGHPHGKLQVLHHRCFARLVPNSINPQHLQYDRVMETGAAGCGVFTRGGKFVGIHSFAGLKEPPPLSCWFIKPILDTALVLVSTSIFSVKCL